MKKVALLGHGLVGSFIAKQLKKDPSIQLKIWDSKLNSKLDLSNPLHVIRAINGADIVVNALPGSIGYDALKTSIVAGKDVVDISFMEEDFTDLHQMAIKSGSTAVVDFGFAPGLCHMIVAKHLREMGTVDKCEIFVGGLPEDPKDEYKAVFSASDVIEEYIRPARYLSGGEVHTEEPFEEDYGDEEYMSAFISDGLRSLLTLDIPELVEYTYRYKKHFDKIKGLKEDGFFSPMNIERTAQILMDKWKMPKNFKDRSMLDVISANSNETRIFSLEDSATDEDHSMARMTGIPAVTMVKLLVEGYSNPGVIVPEAVEGDVLEAVIHALEDYGIEIEEYVYEG